MAAASRGGIEPKSPYHLLWRGMAGEDQARARVERAPDPAPPPPSRLDLIVGRVVSFLSRLIRQPTSEPGRSSAYRQTAYAALHRASPSREQLRSQGATLLTRGAKSFPDAVLTPRLLALTMNAIPHCPPRFRRAVDVSAHM